MNRTALVLFALVAAVSTGCASSSVIRSYPSGATVKSSTGVKLGRTPYTHTDRATYGNQETFIIEHEGYEESSVTIRRDNWNGLRTGGSVVAGLLTFWGFGALLWAQDYEPMHDVTLTALPTADDEDEEYVEAPAPRRVIAAKTTVKKSKTKGSRRSRR